LGATIKFERSLLATDLAQVPVEAAANERMGLHGTFTFDGAHDPFLPIVLAAQDTSTIRLSTQIAVAFARNPMTVAQSAHDLQQITGGRFALGLGTQIQPHVTRRFSMPWSQPVARRREFVMAVRAIWATWETGEPLDFRGEFYEHTLMSPFFVPGASPHPSPPILLAAVGPSMVRAAGAVADGLIVHPFHTSSYLTEVTWPQLDEGLAEQDRDRASFEVVAQSIVAIGRDQEEIARARRSAAAQIGFYASTPAYRPVLEHHAMASLQQEMRALTRAGAWADLAAQVPEELLDLVVTSGTPQDVGAALVARNVNVATTALVLYGDDTLLPALLEAAGAAPRASASFDQVP
jgi:probable F420-dependent oxidoreductase